MGWWIKTGKEPPNSKILVSTKEEEQLLLQAIAKEQAQKRKNRQRQRQLRAEHPEQAQERYEKLRQYPNDPLKRKEAYLRRRAVKRQARVGKVSLKQILEKHGMVCHICGGEIEEGQLHFDHVVSLRRGGEHSMQNIMPAHASCNLAKGWWG